ncbi:hypothetical protein OWV82_019326 [Melia azedarach]|uniref:Uncharacterized protein n=1 Tax=Melia azedarach TaxID=155640 RepID=A0ACC1XFF9_MELAZ|nr:hypothetical protein OWV82_019326 [Melia azedarach]
MYGSSLSVSNIHFISSSKLIHKKSICYQLSGKLLPSISCPPPLYIHTERSPPLHPSPDISAINHPARLIIMAKFRFMFAFVLLSLLFFAQSLHISSAREAEAEAAALVLNQKILEGRQLNGSFKLDRPRKLSNYVKKKSAGGIAKRGKGKRKSAAIRTSHLSSFHLAAVLASSLLLAFLVL